MVTIEYAAAVTEKPHVLHVGLRVTLLDGDLIQEVPVRKSHYEGLHTPAKRLAYAQQCAEYHHPGPGAEGKAKRDARRVAWDADDLAAVQTKWVAHPVGRTEDGQVIVNVTHGGLRVQVRVPVDAPDPTRAIRDAWQAEHDRRQAERAKLAAFAMD